MSAQLRWKDSLPFLLWGLLSAVRGLLLLKHEHASFVRLAHLCECLRASIEMDLALRHEYTTGSWEEVPLQEHEAVWRLSLALLRKYLVSHSHEGVPLQELAGSAAVAGPFLRGPIGMASLAPQVQSIIPSFAACLLFGFSIWLRVALSAPGVTTGNVSPWGDRRLGGSIELVWQALQECEHTLILTSHNSSFFSCHRSLLTKVACINRTLELRKTLMWELHERFYRKSSLTYWMECN